MLQNRDIPLPQHKKLDILKFALTYENLPLLAKKKKVYMFRKNSVDLAQEKRGQEVELDQQYQENQQNQFIINIIESISPSIIREQGL